MKDSLACRKNLVDSLQLNRNKEEGNKLASILTHFLKMYPILIPSSIVADKGKYRYLH